MISNVESTPLLHNNAISIVNDIAPTKLLNRKIRRFKLKKKSTLASDSNIQFDSKGYRIGKWDNAEHIHFLEACYKFGNNWSKVKPFYLICIKDSGRN
jgi:hypothetical protein